MERNHKAALAFGFVLSVCFLIVGAYNFGYQEKDITVTVVKKWIEDDSIYFNTTDGRIYELSNSYWLGLYDRDGRFNLIQERSSYMIDTLGGRLNISVFRPNAYNFREVIGLDSSKPLFLFESCFKCYRIN